MKFGGDSNLLGTLYELLVLRELVLDNNSTALTVGKAKGDVTLEFSGGSELFNVLQEFVTPDTPILAQLGDADFGVVSKDGLIIVQLKASLNPEVNQIDKGDLCNILRDAVKHVVAIREMEIGEPTLPVAAFILVSNRPLGNIHQLPEQLKNLNIEEIRTTSLCPVCLGVKPGSRSHAKKQVTVEDWCKQLSDDKNFDVNTAIEVLLKWRYVALSIPECTAKFRRQMSAFGLDDTETADVGGNLLGNFQTDVTDTKSGMTALKCAIFDSVLQFHHFAPSQLRQKENALYSRIWDECNFHRTANEQGSHVASNLTNNLVKSIREVAVSKSEPRILMVTGRGGIGKSYQLLEAIKILREQCYGILLPGIEHSHEPNCLDAAARLFYDGYKRPWRELIWVERLKRSLSAHKSDQPIVLYFPNTDKLDVKDLARLLAALDTIRLDLVVVLTVRQRVLDDHLQDYHRARVTVHKIEKIPSEDVISWLNEQGIHTGLGSGLSVSARVLSSNYSDESVKPSNTSLERIRHPLMFASLSHVTKGKIAEVRQAILNGYLNDDANYTKQFWDAVNRNIASRLGKHLLHDQLTNDSIKGAFQAVYKHRADGPFTIEALNKILNMVDESDRKSIRNQMLQIGILEEIDREQSIFRWAFTEYTPDD